jgi:hypothetical protein
VRVVAPLQANQQIVVQPAAFIDPNVVLTPSSITPAGASSQFSTTFTTPKLSQ